ncbi:MAG: FtsX-like permease family protein, partial [Candidatus Acidiferrales bacterium]
MLGQNIVLDGKPYTIVGVLPRTFDFLFSAVRQAQVWTAVQVPLTSNNPSNGGMFCVGLLKAGVKRAAGEAALTPTLSELRREYPNMFMPDERAHLESFDENVKAGAGTAPLLLFGAVGFVLLIACVNVANLTLARSATRQREMAVRTAIGASRSRIVRQLLTESVMLAVLGGILGVAACYASFSVILSLVPTTLPRISAIAINGYVWAFAFLLSIITGIVFGLVPALGASRVELSNSLKEASAQSGAGRSGGIRTILASGEVAISLVLLIGAALALESLARLASTHPGFDASNVLTFHVDLPRAKYPTPISRSMFFDQALARIAALPGVEKAAIVDTLP